MCNPFPVDKGQDREYVDTPTTCREYGISCQGGYEPCSTDSEKGPAKGKVGVEIYQLSHIYAVAKRVLVIGKLGYTAQTYRANCAWPSKSMKIISVASEL